MIIKKWKVEKKAERCKEKRFGLMMPESKIFHTYCGFDISRKKSAKNVECRS